MIKEPSNESFFYSQIGALEAEVERVKKENHKLQSQNTILKTRLYLNKISYEIGDENGKG